MGFFTMIEPRCKAMKHRYVFLNSLPLNIFKKPVFNLFVTKIKPEILKQVSHLFKNAACYIRHESTVKILNKELGLNLKPCNELYEYKDGDTLIIVSLKKPIRGKEVEELSLKDLGSY